ncbi:Uncharacterised protein [Streptococcus pneumoniae]|nr:Uncharacterised protein [Streptococcus pneumoniae]
MGTDEVEAVDKTDEVSSKYSSDVVSILHVRQGDIDVI